MFLVSVKTGYTFKNGVKYYYFGKEMSQVGMYNDLILNREKGQIFVRNQDGDKNLLLEHSNLKSSSKYEFYPTVIF